MIISSECSFYEALNTMLLYNLAPQVVAFSTERHAVDSSLPYDGFNITHYTGDELLHVEKCRERLCYWLGIEQGHLVLPRQVHGVRMAEVNESSLKRYRSPHKEGLFDGVDALFTVMPRTCIGVSTADCVPILFYDRDTGAVAAAHAGWRGTVAHIAQLTVSAMSERYGTKAAHIQAVIGPSIGPDAFEVGDEVHQAFSAAGFHMDDIAFRRDSRWHIDLWKSNAQDLMDAGVPSSAISIAGLCTHTLYRRFFSARRLGINSGRIFTGIMYK